MTGERVERRLAAILAADVVGYSRLVSADEAGTLARLDESRRGIIAPTIASHAGRLFKIMGDGSSPSGCWGVWTKRARWDRG